MTTNATKLLLDRVVQYNTNPSSIIQSSLDVLEMILDGQDIVDATNPFVFLMEASATGTCGAILKSQAYTNALYPRLGKTMDELYGHISDTEFIGIYATPAIGELKILLPWVPLQEVAISIDDSTTSASVVIPRNTKILVNEIPLSVCYPIYINLLDSEVTQVLYDTSQNNPLLPLSNNSLKHSRIFYQDVDYLQITVPVLQLAVSTLILPLLASASFSQKIVFDNKFCYARAYIRHSGKWQEILTTHSSMIYDIEKPTVKLRVVDNTLTVSLPDIYQTLSLNSNSIRIDIYTTLGELSADLSQVSYSNFSAEWLDYDSLTPNPGADKLAQLNDILIYSETQLSGGSNGSTVDEVRNKVIYHSDFTMVPIRFSDIKTSLSTLGYTVQKLIDTITDRVYIASKHLPDRVVDKLHTTPLSTTSMVTINVIDGTVNGSYNASLKTHSTNRLTIKPNALYKLVNGVVILLNNSELSTIYGLSNTDLCTYLNAGVYLYSPFYYTIDYTTSYLTTKAYYLSKPKITGRTFKAANSARNYNIATESTTIELLDTGYRLTIITSIPAELQGINCQLVFYHKDTGNTLYLNSTSTVMAANAVFTFDFQTSFDINGNGKIEITNMLSGININTPIFIDFETTFDIFYLVEGTNVGLETTFDNLYNASSLNTAVIGASYETLTIEFGKIMDGLYCPNKEIITTGSYVKYGSVVYATYTEPVYATNSLGKTYTINIDGTVTFNIIHQVGDPILDGEGSPVILHNIGDFVLDSFGEKIPTDTYLNSISYSIGLTLFDAKYKFATATKTKKYNDDIPFVIDNYLSREIATIRGNLTERTELLYRPKGDPYQITVNIGNGITATVPSVLDIELTFSIISSALEDLDVLTNIRILTRTLLSTYIKLNTISATKLLSDLLAVSPSQVIGITIDKFLPNGATVVTLTNEANTFSIRELLVVQADNTLEVEDGIIINIKSSV